MNYYNDNDPFIANWLRCLIRDGLIPPGDVDERSITDVQPQDLKGYTQYHFFAGIGGWPLALQIAGWPADEPVWTGSCPCQPLSIAGKQQGEKDERHLWPEFYRLISECRPFRIFGEQSESPDGIEWLDGISLDLEEIGYAVGSVDLPSACVSAPNKRQRAWWVANTNISGFKTQRECENGRWGEAELCRKVWDRYRIIGGRDGKSRRIPVESALFPLAARIPGRVGLLRGSGNAINPLVAAEFIRAYMEIIGI